MEILGLLAGNGIYPATAVAAARRAGVKRIVVAAFDGETDPKLEHEVDCWACFRVGQLGKMIRYFRAEGVRDAMMVGQIAPKNLFDLRPDMRTLLLLGRLKQRNAESIFGGIADELAKDGVTLLPATTFLDDQMPGEGPVCGPPLTSRQKTDAVFALGTAKETSRLDIGQSVVVRHGTVLAVEAFEGTNACIQRGGELGRGKALLAKVSKPEQDLRFDVPVIGPETLETCAAAGVCAVVVEAGFTLMLAPDQVAALADKHGIAVHAMTPE